MSAQARKPLTKVQIIVLSAAFVPMLATGVVGGIGTYSNISGAYGTGTALGAVAAGEGATAVLALVLLGLTMLGQASPRIIRLGLWALPAAASAMAAMAADNPGTTVIYAVTPMGMCVSAEGMAFLARRIAVHTDGHDAEESAGRSRSSSGSPITGPAPPTIPASGSAIARIGRRGASRATSDRAMPSSDRGCSMCSVSASRSARTPPSGPCSTSPPAPSRPRTQIWRNLPRL